MYVRDDHARAAPRECDSATRADQEVRMDAQVTSQSQTYRLEERAREAKLRHGQEVRADIPRVRVAPDVYATTASSHRLHWFWSDVPAPAERTPAETTSPRGDVFFCNIGRMRVREVLVEGDEAPLPSNVILEGLTVPKAGNYDLVNVLVRTNGAIRLIVDAETQVVPVATSPTF
jgi:hypothetical protein